MPKPLPLPIRRAPLRAERRRLLVASAVAIGSSGLMAVAGRAAAAGFDLTQLMKTLSAVRAGEATFVERREVRVLDRTVESAGRLRFEAPDTFIRETLRPRADRLAVTGNTVTMTQGGRSRTMELDATPEAAAIVEAVRGTLTGNRQALERLFEPSVTGTAANWALELLPREARLRNQVASVKVRGEQAVVRVIEVLLADGDRSTMTITPTTSSAAAPAGANAAVPAGAKAPATSRGSTP